MKNSKKSLFGNFYSPYMTEEKTNMDSWYEDYKNDSEKTISINGCIYSKIIYRHEFYSKYPCSLIVLIDPIEKLNVDNVLIDENGNEYTIKGFEMIRFTEIPEWYPRIRPIHIIGATYHIGNYLAKKE